jgi:hypothetical protein
MHGHACEWLDVDVAMMNRMNVLVHRSAVKEAMSNIKAVQCVFVCVGAGLINIYSADTDRIDAECFEHLDKWTD